MAKNLRNKKKVSKDDPIKREKRREQIRLAMKRNRAKLSEEQIEERRRKDRERYKQKKSKGLTTSIKQLTPRAQRIMRKQWKDNSKRYRERQKNNKQIARQTDNLVENDTPPNSPHPSNTPSLASTSRTTSGRKIALRNRRLLKLENTLLKSKLKELEKKLSKYKMCCNRAVAKVTSSSKRRSKASDIIHKKKLLNIKLQIQKFLETDDCSRLTAGKKETITKKKIKKQIRLLNDALLTKKRYKKRIPQKRRIFALELDTSEEEIF